MKRLKLDVEKEWLVIKRKEEREKVKFKPLQCEKII